VLVGSKGGDAYVQASLANVKSILHESGIDVEDIIKELRTPGEVKTLADWGGSGGDAVCFGT
jgi:hypothetical protein